MWPCPALAPREKGGVGGGPTGPHGQEEFVSSRSRWMEQEHSVVLRALVTLEATSSVASADAHRASPLLGHSGWHRVVCVWELLTLSANGNLQVGTSPLHTCRRLWWESCCMGTGDPSGPMPPPPLCPGRESACKSTHDGPTGKLCVHRAGAAVAGFVT